MQSKVPSLTITADCVVSLKYILTDSEGTILDMSSPDAPMRYMHGHGNIIRGLENRLTGLRVGERGNFEICPEEAYGLRDGDPQEVPKSIFPQGTEFKVGAGMMAKSEDGKPFPLWIVRVEEDSIYVDANHPLAGQTLHFDVEILAIRPATEDELKDGVPHDGCDACRP